MSFFKVIIFGALLTITIVGCTKKSVQIPVLDATGIQDTIYDNSQIWMFLDVKDGDTIASLNLKNSISTTSWIFNIDKSLPMELVIPHLQKLIDKREKPAMHPKDEDDFNYFTFVDSGTNLLSLVKFDVIYFENDSVSDKNRFENDTLKNHFFVHYSKDKLSVNDSLIHLNNLETYLENEMSKKIINVHLQFDSAMKYQNYLALKSKLQNIKDIELDTIEVFY